MQKYAFLVFPPNFSAFICIFRAKKSVSECEKTLLFSFTTNNKGITYK